jgi:thiol-disulfide isomerase/thioredoxin
MNLAKPILVALLAVALAVYAFDCGAMTMPEQAMQCCNFMPCSSQGHRGQDCCKTMPAMHAPFVPIVTNRGKVVLIDFWATWCQPCKKEMPGYQKLIDRYGSQGFAVVGFKFDTMMDTEDPVLFAKKIGVRYPLAVAADDLKQRFGGIEGLPTTMLYDRQGILRKKVIGFEYTDALESALKPLL